jgi:hypothetical protein
LDFTLLLNLFSFLFLTTMSCKENPRLAKNKRRKAPPIQARDCEVGEVRPGQDGILYEIVENNKGGKTWKKKLVCVTDEKMDKDPRKMPPMPPKPCVGKGSTIGRDGRKYKAVLAANGRAKWQAKPDCSTRKFKSNRRVPPRIAKDCFLVGEKRQKGNNGVEYEAVEANGRYRWKRIKEVKVRKTAAKPSSAKPCTSTIGCETMIRYESSPEARQAMVAASKVLGRARTFYTFQKNRYKVSKLGEGAYGFVQKVELPGFSVAVKTQDCRDYKEEMQYLRRLTDLANMGRPFTFRIIDSFDDKCRIIMPVAKTSLKELKPSMVATDLRGEALIKMGLISILIFHEDVRAFDCDLHAGNFLIYQEHSPRTVYQNITVPEVNFQMCLMDPGIAQSMQKPHGPPCNKRLYDYYRYFGPIWGLTAKKDIFTPGVATKIKQCLKWIYDRSEITLKKKKTKKGAKGTSGQIKGQNKVEWKDLAKQADYNYDFLGKDLSSVFIAQELAKIIDA